MKPFTLLIAAGAMAVLGSAEASRPSGGWDRGYRADGHRGHHHHGGRYWVAPRYYPRYYSPYSYYLPPLLYAPAYYPYTIYPPGPPVVIERYYPEPVYRAPPPRTYSERSQAQITPPATAPRAAPRLERQTLSAKELFEFDQATLRMPQPKLDEIAEVLKRNLQIENVRITGHTDRIGTDAYNMKLSQRRAEAVKAYLVKKGVAASRLTAIGKGEANPVAECKDTKKQAELIKCLEPNRRVEVEQITVERRVS